MQSLDELPKHHFGAILADPPWHFNVWYGGGMRHDKRSMKPGTYYNSRSATRHYETMTDEEITSIPINDLAAENCVLFLWTCWPMLQRSLKILEQWGFEYKTCAFCWTKANGKQIDLFREDITPRMGLGYWTRANTEPCLLATKGQPKRIGVDVRQAIIEPIRQHSRKPDVIHERIERLVAGPYLELFARQERKGWTTWGNETKKFKAVG